MQTHAADDNPSGPLGMWSVGELAKRAGLTVAQVLQAFYAMARMEPPPDRWAILNVGCKPDELDAAEARIQHPLHPLHRLILTVSNGGTIPFVGLSLIGAAVPRESEKEWRIMGPYLTAQERAVRPALTMRQERPIPALVLGNSLRDEYGDAVADTYDLDALIPFAAGFGRQWYCYVRSNPHQILEFMGSKGGGAYHGSWSDFAEFIKEVPIYYGHATMDFAARTQATWRALKLGVAPQDAEHS